MKITSRIAVSSVTMMSVIFFLGLSGYLGLLSMYKKLDEVAEISRELEEVSDLHLHMREAVSHLNGYLVTGDPATRERFREASKKVEEAFDAVYTIEDRPAKTDRSLENAKVLYGNIRDLGDELFRIPAPLNNERALTLMVEVHENADWITHLYIQLHQLKDREKLEAAIGEVEATKKWTDLIQKAGFVVAPLIGIFLIVYNTRAIIRPIKRLTDGAIRVSSGDWGHRFDIRDGEELTQLSTAIDTMSRTILGQIDDLERLFRGTVKTLAAAVDAKSPWTRGHSERVTSYALAAGAEMGLPGSDLKTLELACLLHDIGKIGTYESILEKAGKLTTEEFRIISEHPVKGAEILAHVKNFEDIVPIVRNHHENYDGSGYPDRLKGNEIPLMARIVAVCDAYDAMTSDRPYRKSRTRLEAIEELKRCSGMQFDPEAVSAFIRAMGVDHLI